ncbi:MAG TPA: DUF4907 domain-containing protein [Chitinophagaceae bacterium]|nr:DUF4907 domain-containing protein [Chitinophagaceae bacterium]
MKVLLVFTCLFFASLSARASQSPGDTSFTIIPVAKNAWGYNINLNGKVFIHQTTIPGMQGNIAFSRKTDAENTAKLVVQKIKKGIMPPSVSLQELQQLNIYNLKKQ